MTAIVVSVLPESKLLAGINSNRLKQLSLEINLHKKFKTVRVILSHGKEALCIITITVVLPEGGNKVTSNGCMMRSATAYAD